MVCHRCANVNEHEARYCQRCGFPVLPAAMPTATAQSYVSGKITNVAPSTSDHDAWLWRFIAFIVICAMMVAGYYFFHYNHAAYPQIVITSPENIPAAAPPQESPEMLAVAQSEAEVTLEQKMEAVLDKTAACTAGQFSCMRSASDSRADPECPAYKPIWAYYTTDKGLSWKRAGCYATEIDAGKGLKLALQAPLKPKLEKPTFAPPETPTTAVEIPALNPAEPMAETPQANEPMQSVPKVQKDVYTVKFKGAFGLTVEKRSYRSAEMKQKALELWDKEHKLLEPDGSINEKYAIQPQKTGLIPGH